MTSDLSSVSITVLMAEYNTDPEHLKNAISSILAQTERDFELLIVDDGTSTDLHGIVGAFADTRIRVLGGGENRGFAQALNAGLEAARGEYIARMDTDDISEPQYLQTTVGFLRRHPEFAVVSARAREVSSDGTELILGRPGEITAEALMRGNAPIHPATVMRAAPIRVLGGYPSYRRSEDLALWCEVLLAGNRIYMLPDVLCRYRVDPADYRKRRLRNRGDELRVRLLFYPKLGAGIAEYAHIGRSVLSGLLPTRWVRWIRTRIHTRR